MDVVKVVAAQVGIVQDGAAQVGGDQVGAGQVNVSNLSYSAHSSDSQTAIVQRIESTHRSGVTTAPSTGSPRVSLCLHRLAPKTRRRSAFPPLSARRWWRRSTADASPPTEACCCSARWSDNSVSPIRLRR